MDESQLRLSDQPSVLKINEHPKRPKPILEIGDPFLSIGPISKGIELPTGAVWNPAFMMWGTLRSAVQSFYDGNDYTTEWANRFDLHGNLYLTQTERIVATIRFLDQDGKFSGYTFSAPESTRQGGKGGDDEWNFDIYSLFFEGDFGELFPNLDANDSKGLDFGFSIGRQLLNFQDGICIA